MGTNSWQNARFSEYKNTGAGATVNSNRKQLTDAAGRELHPREVPGRHGRLEPALIPRAGRSPATGARPARPAPLDLRSDQ